MEGMERKPSRPVQDGRSTVGRAGRFVRNRSRRFVRVPRDPALHEERGLGWRASWREGAERLVLQREPQTVRRNPRFVSGVR